MRLVGMPVRFSEYLTKPEERIVSRSWRERWLSWPWRPWVATRTLTVQVPSNEALMVGGYLVMHPQAFKALQSGASKEA